MFYFSYNQNSLIPICKQLSILLQFQKDGKKYWLKYLLSKYNKVIL